jgi:hypothetical protein
LDPLVDCNALEKNDIRNGEVDYYNGAVNLDTPGLSDWNLPANSTYVVFVDGSLTIDEDVRVPNSSFLAFIVRGNITIAPNVQRVQGVYIADGTLTTNSAGANADTQLQAEGMFVGWSGVNLRRDLGNDSVAAELFTYRPDFLLNALEDLKLPQYEWREVAPDF